MFAKRWFVVILSCLMFAISGTAVGWTVPPSPANQGGAAVSDATVTEPNKAVLIASLRSLFESLQKGDYEKASEHVVLPPNFKPEMFGELAKLSPRILVGLERIAQDGQFGKAVDVFGAKRAESYAKRVPADAADCYGIELSTEAGRAFAVARWDGDSFKMIELEGVHELKPKLAADSSAVQTAKAEPAVSPGKPDKATLIATLKTAFELLQREDYRAASEHFVLPPDFEPEMLSGLIKRQEVSADGIARLEQDARFGTAIEVFGAERAAYFAQKVSADVQQCFGFNHETEQATGEVIAFWDGAKFKLGRLDDIGKLKSPE